MTTRAQLRLIAHEDPRATRLGVQLHPFQVMSSATALQRPELAPHERWLVTVPLRDPAQPALVNFRVEQGIFVSGRFLGCRISIVE